MMFPIPRRASHIGIDLGARTIRAIQFASPGRVAASLCLPRSDPKAPINADELHNVAGVLRRQGFLGSTISLSPPKSAVQTAMIELPPPDSGAPLATIARSEFARARRIDPGTFELTWWTPHDAGPPARGRVIAVACEHIAAGLLLAPWEVAGFRVAALTPGPSALAWALHLDSSDLRGPQIIIDLGWSSCDVIIAHRGETLFYRTVKNAGVGVAHDTCASACNVSLEHAAWMLGEGREEAPEIAAVVTQTLADYGTAVASVVRTTRAYAQECWRGNDFGVAYVAGGKAVDSEMIDWLQANTGLSFLPLPVASDSPAAMDSTMALASGLARSGWIPESESAEPSENVSLDSTSIVARVRNTSRKRRLRKAIP